MPDTLPPQAPAPQYAPAPAPAAADPLMLDMGNLPPPTSRDAPARVPYGRFHDVVQARAQAQAQAQALQADLDAARAQVADWEKKWEPVSAWESQKTEMEAAHQQAIAQVQELHALERIGLLNPDDPATNDLVDAARWAYQRTPEEGRPSFVDALKAWQTDPATAPVILRPHLAASAQQPPAGTQTPAGQQTPAQPAYRWPNSNNGAVSQPPQPGQREVIGQARYRALRSEGKSAQDIGKAYQVDPSRA